MGVCSEWAFCFACPWAARQREEMVKVVQFSESEKSVCVHSWEVYNETDPYQIYARCTGCGVIAYKTVAQETRISYSDDQEEE